MNQTPVHNLGASVKLSQSSQNILLSNEAYHTPIVVITFNITRPVLLLLKTISERALATLYVGMGPIFSVLGVLTPLKHI